MIKFSLKAGRKSISEELALEELGYSSVESGLCAEGFTHL